MPKKICIYHGNCADGFTSAWVAKRFGDVTEGETEFIPGVYGEVPPNVIDAHVLLVDFSYKRPVMESLIADAASVVVLDHHKTAQADLSDLPGAKVIFDMERSGAQITWDYFRGPNPRPAIVDYVADRDLWRFDLSGSREVAAWYFSFPYDFEIWDTLADQLSTGEGIERAISEGSAIERKHHKDIAELLKVTARPMIIGGHEVMCANLPYTMSSDAAGALSDGAPFGACYFDRADGSRIFSLRSRGDKGLDVSEIAKSYGGGGHRNASGFQAPRGWEGDQMPGEIQ